MPPDPKPDYNRIRDIRIGLEIFERHGGINAAAEHDIFYAGPKDDDMACLTPAEISTLTKHGWFVDDETDSWAIFT